MEFAAAVPIGRQQSRVGTRLRNGFHKSETLMHSKGQQWPPAPSATEHAPAGCRELGPLPPKLQVVIGAAAAFLGLILLAIVGDDFFGGWKMYGHFPIWRLLRVITVLITSLRQVWMGLAFLIGGSALSILYGKKSDRLRPALQVVIGAVAALLAFTLLAMVVNRFFGELLAHYEYSTHDPHPLWRLPVMVIIGLIVSLRQKWTGLAFLVSGAVISVLYAVNAHIFAGLSCMACS